MGWKMFDLFVCVCAVIFIASFAFSVLMCINAEEDEENKW